MTLVWRSPNARPQLRWRRLGWLMPTPARFPASACEQLFGFRSKRAAAEQAVASADRHLARYREGERSAVEPPTFHKSETLITIKQFDEFDLDSVKEYDVEKNIVLGFYASAEEAQRCEITIVRSCI